MKKSLVAALTGMLVVGAAGTTFAAANPFSDVPAGHWAYNSVTKLASEGVIEGYGDGTYRGNRNITRYEMAQMVARALAKAPSSNMSAASRAELDKLQAEFRDELDSLGVRVEELERNADKVKWTGKIEYTYNHHKYSGYGYGKEKEVSHNGVFRLEPVAEVNDHWTAHARFDANYNGKDDSTGYTENDGTRAGVKLKRVYAQGDYDKFGVKLGRFGFCPAVEDGVVVDTVVSGAELSYGSKWKFTLTAGRIGAKSDEAHYDSTAAEKGAVIFDNNYRTTYDNAYDVAYNTTYDTNYANYLAQGYTADNAASLAKDDALTAGTVAGENAVLTSANNAAYKAAYDTTYALEKAKYKAMGYTDDGAAALANTAAVAAGNNAKFANYDKVVEAAALVGANAYPTDIIGLNIGYADPGDKGLYGGLSYYYAKDKDFKNYFYSKNGDKDKASVVAANIGYRFNDKLKLWGSYARNGKADQQKDGWAVDLRYGDYGDYAEKGSWAVWAGYAKFGSNVAIASSQSDDIATGEKGWHVGVGYAPFKNVGVQLRYANAKVIDTQIKDRHFWARCEFFF